MSTVGFFTPVKFENYKGKTIGNSLLESIDNYFYLGGKKAYVVKTTSEPGKTSVLLEEDKAPSEFISLVKKVSYCTIWIPLLLLLVKAALRATHTFKVIDAKTELESGMNLSANTIDKIKSIAMKIHLRAGRPSANYTFLSEPGYKPIFKHSEFPDYVFKFDRPDRYGSRYDNMIKAKKVCLTHNLGLLVIPQSTSIVLTSEGGRDVVLILEKVMNIGPKSEHENEYNNCPDDLTETVRQMAEFIALTKFSDVSPRNIPLIKEEVGFKGPRRIALIDLECMEDAKGGFGGYWLNASWGLISSVPAKYRNTVYDVAKKYNLLGSE